MIRNANGVTAIYLIRWRKGNTVDMQYYLPDHPQFGYAEGVLRYFTLFYGTFFIWVNFVLQ